MTTTPNFTKRLLLFLFGCILTRFIFAYIAKIINPTYLPILGSIALIISIGFFYIYLTNSRKNGPEVFGEGIWWNNYRPVHGLLYLLFAITAILKKSYSWIFLLVDVIFGLLVFLIHHFL